MSPPPVASTSFASRTLFLGGLLSAPVGLLTLAFPPAIPASEWGHPFTPGMHVVVSVCLVCLHLLKAHGFAFGLARLRDGVTRWSMWVAAVGFAVVAVCEGISATMAGVPIDTQAAIDLNNGYGFGSMLLAIPSMIGGVIIARERLLPGLARWSVLGSGAFMIFVVTPALIMGRAWPAYVALAVWSLFYVWIGHALGRVAQA
ncbi:MAG: hypothetical protein EP330_14015 [Deltaproteobacteria bacterium]|nr:MAG: hypothetical protein EP330_14015 [Deltaproteobacteria bacterium]